MTECKDFEAWKKTMPNGWDAWDAWQASRKQALTDAIHSVGELHATDRAPESTRHFYDSVITAAQEAIRSLGALE